MMCSVTKNIISKKINTIAILNKIPYKKYNNKYLEIDIKLQQRNIY